jgi:hypothetical protein
MKSKFVVLATGGMVALMLLSRYFVLRRAGMPLGWMLYLGLPITAAGVLFALALINLGAWCSTKIDAPGYGGNIQGSMQAHPVAPASGPSPSQRLKELEDLHTAGVISDTQYSARRLQIIASA